MHHDALMRSYHAGIKIDLVDWDTFQDNPFSLIQYIEGEASDLLHMVQTVKCEGVNFEENSQQATSSSSYLNYTVPAFIGFETKTRTRSETIIG